MVYVDQNVIHSFNALFPVNRIIWKLGRLFKKQKFLAIINHFTSAVNSANR